VSLLASVHRLQVALARVSWFHFVTLLVGGRAPFISDPTKLELQRMAIVGDHTIQHTNQIRFTLWDRKTGVLVHMCGYGKVFSRHHRTY
jgi:hypothetical protein